MWRIEVTPTELRPIRELVLVDATRGNVALHFNQVDTARQRQTHTANNGTTLPGTLVCDESNPTCAGGDAHAAAAHLNAGDTYDFYLANHGRDGITGTGSVIRSTVHYSVGYDNAFWNGSQMVYGDAAGFPLADDVVAHELTHGVTQYTSRLYLLPIRRHQRVVLGSVGRVRRSDQRPWQRFEWRAMADGRGRQRSWRDSQHEQIRLYGSPDRLRSVLYYLGEDDNGGVHVNSGINNKAAYLMVDGGTFNGQTVQPLGIIKTAKIYYEAQTNLLTSGSDYEDLYNALFQACQNLVGTSNIFAADCDEVRKATLAVEMNLQPIAGFNVEAPLCAAGEAPTSVFFDDLETSSANFSAMVAAGTSRWVYTTSFAHSGQRALYGNDAPAAVYRFVDRDDLQCDGAEQRVPPFRSRVWLREPGLRRWGRRIHHQRGSIVVRCRRALRQRWLHRNDRQRIRKPSGRPSGIHRRQSRICGQPAQSIVAGRTERQVPMANEHRRCRLRPGMVGR